jgi:hypothetical protein
MKKLAGMAFAAAVISLLSSLPSMAQQSGLTITFATTFSFYAGSAKLPPGTYTLAEISDQPNAFTLESKSGAHSVIVEGRQSSKTTKGSPQVVFNKYETMDILESVETSTGNSVDLNTGVAEKIAAKKGSPQSHAVPAT